MAVTFTHSFLLENKTGIVMVKLPHFAQRHSTRAELSHNLLARGVIDPGVSLSEGDIGDGIRAAIR